MPSRVEDLRRFYELLNRLAASEDGPTSLGSCGPNRVPQRGVYFFFEDGEFRTDSGEGPRVVRVGTHAVSEGSKASLWGRLSQHRGVVKSGGGNHRGSIFRLIVGEALSVRDKALGTASWGKGSSADRETRAREHELERAVSAFVRTMRLVWLGIDDASGKGSLRARIETNSIALLSNFGKTVTLDRPSSSWLGLLSSRPKVQKSGLWNSRDVDAEYDPFFLDDFERLILAKPAV